MGCDYYTEKSIIINYISSKGETCRIITNTKRERGFINKYEPNTDKFNKKMNKYTTKNTYKKMIYENNTWLQDTYQEKYETKFRKWFPHIKDFIQIYKASVAWGCK